MEQTKPHIESSISKQSHLLSQLWQRRTTRWAIGFVFFLIFIALAGPFLANERPLYCTHSGNSFSPVAKQVFVNLGLSAWEAPYSSTYDWKAQTYERVLYPIIPYSASSLDIKNANFKSPFEGQRVEKTLDWHWLGTDKLGRDILAGMIEGTRTALLVGIIAMAIASFIGIILGAFAGYFGDDKLQVTPIRLLMILLGLVVGYFYSIQARFYQLTELGSSWEYTKSLFLFALILSLFWSFSLLVERISILNKKITLPVDLLVMRLIELFNSIPGLLLLLAIIPILKNPTILSVMVIIGLIGWTGIARFTRAEMLRIRNLEYMQAARVLGFSQLRMIFRHALPNALSPVLITIAFGIANAILLEASISFLNLGISGNTWGSILNTARIQPTAWWLALAPGLAIFLSVMSFNLIGEALTDGIKGQTSRK